MIRPDCVHGDRLRLASKLEGAAGLEVEAAAIEQSAGCLGRKHRLTEITRRVLDPGSDIHGIADHTEFSEAPTADRAAEDESGVDSDTDPAPGAELRLDRSGDSARRGESAVSVVGDRVGSAEDGEQAVAEQFVHAPPMAFDDRHDQFEELVRYSTASSAVERSAKPVNPRMSTKASVAIAHSGSTRSLTLDLRADPVAKATCTPAAWSRRPRHGVRCRARQVDLVA